MYKRQVLRRQGASYAQIGERVGVSSARAATLVSKAIKRVLKEPAEDVRAIELSRIEIMISKLWTPALAELDQKDPDYRKFDRLKALIETKLRWCGAQQVIEDHSDKRVQIIIQSFGGNNAADHDTGKRLESTPPPDAGME